jgi:hypothetical protein
MLPLLAHMGVAGSGILQWTHMGSTRSCQSSPQVTQTPAAQFAGRRVGLEGTASRPGRRRKGGIGGHGRMVGM